MPILNVYNENEKCQSCLENPVTFIVVDESFDGRFCTPCFSAKMKDEVICQIS